MADLYNIVCITTNANRGQDLKELRNALIDIDENYNKCLPYLIYVLKVEYTTAKVKLSELMHKISKKKLTKACGMVSGE